LADVSTPAVVKMANRMSEAGLVRRARDEKDSRLVRLWLTAKGRDLQGPVERERTDLDDALTSALSASDKRRLLEMLEIVHRSAQNLRGNYSDRAPDA
jgi:DNA-binding MarR family transcriptional regulator